MQPHFVFRLLQLFILWKILLFIQIRACRVILGLKAKEPTSIHMKNLHWLKIKERIEFQILLLAYKSLTGKSPSYLTNLINYNCISGSRTPSLSPHPVRTSAGARAFQHCAPVLWNKLPINMKCCNVISQFKKQLKTLLFDKSYSNCE